METIQGCYITVKSMTGIELCLAVHADGGRQGNVSADDSSGTNSDEEPCSESKGPSRSARRKKLKRQLRRQGLVNTGSTEKPAAQAGVKGREERPQAAVQALPKRGDAWALSRTEMQFMQEGHVYFTDSVCLDLVVSQFLRTSRASAARMHVMVAPRTKVKLMRSMQRRAMREYALTCTHTTANSTCTCAVMAGGRGGRGTFRKVAACAAAAAAEADLQGASRATHRAKFGSSAGLPAK